MNELTFEKGAGFATLRRDLEHMVRGLIPCVSSLTVPREAAE
jgi:hypothetical protein